VDRLKNPDRVFREFSDESVRGMKDVMAQQLNQGFLGDMSRQARLAASCVQYRGDGVFHIRTGNETLKSVSPCASPLLSDPKYPLGGNSCMRAISEICSRAQQAALDSHRVSQSVSSKLDLINNFITGGSESLVALISGALPSHSWKYVNGNTTFCVVNNDDVKQFATRVVAAYNPVVLKAVKLLNGDVKEVCKNGILTVCNYHGIELSMLEVYSLVELLCYRPEVDAEPITTKRGMFKREMRWMPTVFANHYGKLKAIQRKGTTLKQVRPETITEATAVCNFDFL